MNAMQFFKFASSEPYSGKSFIDGGKPFGYEECDKCSGNGAIEYFSHVAQGVCFSCHGEKVTRFRLYDAKQNAAQLRRIEKAGREQQSRAAVLQEINALYSMRGSVRQGFWNIQKLHQKAASDFFGQVGDRVEIDAVLEVVIGFDGFYGTTYINTMRDSAGNVFVYKGGKRLGKKGDTISLKATVKEHGEYKGVKQTVINRPSITSH